MFVPGRLIHAIRFTENWGIGDHFGRGVGVGRLPVFHPAHVHGCVNLERTFPYLDGNLLALDGMDCVPKMAANDSTTMGRSIQYGVESHSMVEKGWVSKPFPFGCSGLCWWSSRSRQ